ncbi:hypothetical protein SARC_16757, partial [Sphaeroforma arctica JP610]
VWLALQACFSDDKRGDIMRLLGYPQAPPAPSPEPTPTGIHTHPYANTQDAQRMGMAQPDSGRIDDNAPVSRVGSVVEGAEASPAQ